jgi:hypothetical protein
VAKLMPTVQAGQTTKLCSDVRSTTQCNVMHCLIAEARHRHAMLLLECVYVLTVLAAVKVALSNVVYLAMLEKLHTV